MAAVDLSLHPKQAVAFNSSATEILFGGAAGGGKSHLMRVVAIAFCAQVAGLQVYLFRRLSDDLYKNHMEGAGGFYSMLDAWLISGHVRFNGSKNYLEFWNGSKIWLSHCQHEKDVEKYRGAEIHLLLIDELTHFTDKIYRFLRARCRLGGLAVPEELKSRLPMILCGSNPSGVGHTWVKRSFVDFAPPLEVVRTPKSEGAMLRQFIPSRLDDNPTQDADYADRLSGLGDDALIRAMLEGDWNIVAGGALDDVWSPRCIVPRFKVPSSWRLDRAFDWGSEHPFSVGWFAESDGTEATLEDGTIFAPPKGSIIQFGEWYGTPSIGTNKGLRLSSKEIAEGVNERESDFAAGEWISGKVNAGVADNQISNVIDKSVPTIAETMAREGVRWTKSDKSAGSRVVGLNLMRDRLREASKDYPESPALYFMDHCRASISILPTLPRDKLKPEDVDTKAEDHVYDMVRYRVLAGKKQLTKTDLIKVSI
jgi:hypothetical protein